MTSIVISERNLRLLSQTIGGMKHGLRANGWHETALQMEHLGELLGLVANTGGDFVVDINPLKEGHNGQITERTHRSDQPTGGSYREYAEGYIVYDEATEVIGVEVWRKKSSQLRVRRDGAGSNRGITRTSCE